MATIHEVINQLRSLPTVSHQGIAFERLMVNYLRTDPMMAEQYSEIHRWSDWEHAWGADVGIDLVGRRKEDGGWTAIQCKFYRPTTTIAKPHLDSFFEASGRTFKSSDGVEAFTNRLIISTTDKWSRNAEEMLESQSIQTNRLGLGAISESPLDWDVIAPGKHLQVNLTLREKFEPRPHQAEAIDRALKGFMKRDRGKLIMACGTGKTFTALRLAEQFASERGGKARVLFLVPSISLLSQTLREWTAQANLAMSSVAVCSDSKVSRAAEDIAIYDVEVPVSTNGQKIASRMKQLTDETELTVVFSTYQSLPAVHEAQLAGVPEFDLVICDEAHRTTGVTLAGEDPSNFTRIHDAEYLRADKRLYMTATPRLFDDNVKSKAVEHSAEISSMDDEAVYGPEFYRLGFGEAVEKGLLTDYKVVVMTVDESVAADAISRMRLAPGEELTLDLASSMIGTWNALAKRSGIEQDTSSGFSSAEDPMRRTVGFAKDIKTSKMIAAGFPSLVESYKIKLEEAKLLNDMSEHNVDLQVSMNHVDGTMNALQRSNFLTWLKAPTEDHESKMLTNARCLSEGVDVPALDSIVFFNPRNSMVDVVQSVGRVMRKSPGKNYGYIILPVAVPPRVSPAAVLNDNKRFKVVWQILNALRAHDDRFNAKVNSIKFEPDSVSDLPVDLQHVGPTEDPLTAAEQEEANTQLVLFSLEQWQEAMYTKLVDKVGSRTYWEDWADDVADIAQAQITRITALVENAGPKLRREFKKFVDGLRANLNESITETEAISMLSQHLITAPVFDALFSEHDFVKRNPVAVVMQRMVDALSDKQLAAETESLDRFYDSVRIRASEVTSASGKQEVIRELYERFFQKAFKKQSEALGIVYTPVEIVDFILRAADDLSRKHFGRGLTDEGVNIIDPFTGTGTFVVRLLQSGLIKPEDLARKYSSELFATEIMLLAYYVATVNIETTYQGLMQERAKRVGFEDPEYAPFRGIALADTFQVHEEDDALNLDVFQDNNERIERQKNAPIHVIVGNPPYSVGQRNANDFNANLKYPALDRRIEDSYVARSTAKNKNSLYDSYFRAFRWATDRIGEQGIVAFVSNGGWLDGNSGDGVRLSFADEFSELHVFNLRGNARTSGEQRRKESGNVFGEGTRTEISITIGIKRQGASGCVIHYRNIGDFLTTKEKLDIVSEATVDSPDWHVIVPNQHGDWLNQRSDDFEKWPVLGEKRGDAAKFFSVYSRGLSTARDAWVYAQTPQLVSEKVTLYIKTYETARKKFGQWLVANSISRPKGIDVDNFLNVHQEFADLTKISWNRSLKSNLVRDVEIEFNPERIVLSQYRPFDSRYVYFESSVNDMTYRLNQIFPTRAHQSVGILVTSPKPSSPPAVLSSDILVNLDLLGQTIQFFPRFTWDHIQAPERELNSGSVEKNPETCSKYGPVGEIVEDYRRVDNITDGIKKLYRDTLGADITGDDIFHFVYGKLHDPNYRKAYGADLKKMLPHLETPTERAVFDKFAGAGEQLMDLHVSYEDAEPYPLEVELKVTSDPEDRETWRVKKMRWAKKKDSETGKSINDLSTIIYNTRMRITGIPEEADEYMLGSRSALAWIIDRYQVTTHKKSGIVNDPNDRVDDGGNPRYIVDLIGKVTRVAVETVRIVKELEN